MLGGNPLIANPWIVPSPSPGPTVCSKHGCMLYHALSGQSLDYPNSHFSLRVDTHSNARALLN